MPYRLMLSRFIDRIRASPGLALLVVLAAAAVYAFVELVDEVLEGESRAFDEWVLQVLRSPGDPGQPIGPWWVETMFVDITALGGTTVVTLMTLAVLGYLIIHGKRHTALLVLVSVAGGAGLSSALKLGFDRPRPDLVAHLVEVQTLSFPSGHAMASSALAFSAVVICWSTRFRWAGVMLAVAYMLVIGFTRLYLGVHYPSDVVAGWAVSAAWVATMVYALTYHTTLRKVFRKKRL